MGVQYSLWGGSVVNLGTERHREKYFDDIDSFRLPGCGSAGKLSGRVSSGVSWWPARPANLSLICSISAGASQ
jgi:hypothetical protein